MSRQHTWWRPSQRRNTKSFHWFICTFCGLVLLKNAATQKLVKQGCKGAEQEDGQ